MRRRYRRIGWLLVAPATIFLLALTVFPFLYMIYMSFFQYNLAQGIEPRFIGLGNYRNIFSDPTVGDTVEFTAVLTIFALPIEMLLGFAIALLVRETVGESLWRALILLPMMVPAVVAGIAWKMLYNYQFGPLNYMLSLLGIEKVSWLGQSVPARAGVIIIDVWQWTPFVFLVLYAGLQSVPVDLIDSAKVDGASRWGITRYVELPLVLPLALVVLILRLIDVLKLFDIVYMTTYGGPGTATYSYSFYIYNVGFAFGFDVGYGAALSILLLIVVTILVNALMRLVRLDELLQLKEGTA